VSLAEQPRLDFRQRLPVAPEGGWVRRSVYLRDITLHLVRREFATRHRGSVLGWFWALAPPLLQLVVTYFLFTKVIPLGVKNFPVFLLTGILAWNLFARSITMAASSLESGRDLVQRPGFPIVMLPVVSVLTGLVDYLIALPILLIALAFTTGLHASALLLPFLVLEQLVLTLGIVWLLAPSQTFFRDVAHLAGVALMLGFWLTPIFYQPTSVPSHLAWVYNLNPMAHLIEAQRSVMLNGTLPAAGPLLWVAGFSLLLALAGFAFFRMVADLVPEQL
jgi:lipopolysaccharide transport system permease protein